jgi:hypothetical protein
MLIPPGQTTPSRSTDPAPHHPDQADEDTWDMGLPHEQAALEALLLTWGEAYSIGCDEGQWWFRRLDRKGATETAYSPDALHAQILIHNAVYLTGRAALPPPPEQPAPGKPASSAKCEARSVQWI